MSLLIHPATSLVYLIRLELGYRLDTLTWTQGTTPYTFCYYLSHPEGEPSFVLEDGVEYTEVASLALVNSTVSSWWWNAGNLRLYAHTSTGVSPASGTFIILSRFWENFASHSPITYAGKYCEPRLKSESIKEISMGVPYFGQGGLQLSFGDVSFINSDGYFDSRLCKYIYEAAHIEARAANLVIVNNKIISPSDGDFILFWEGWTGNVYWTDDTVRMDTEDFRKVMA